MRIKRAHNYDPIMAIRASLARLPAHWLEAANKYQWIVYPDDLSPVWTGLVYNDAKTHDGDRVYSTVGGWCASEEHDWFCDDVPHIFLNHSAAQIGSAVHEVGHALEKIWHAPVSDLFNPEKAFYEYMASNAAEYFACAFQAYLTPEQDEKRWNKHDLAKRDIKIYEWFEVKRDR